MQHCFPHRALSCFLCRGLTRYLFRLILTMRSTQERHCSGSILQPQNAMCIFVGYSLNFDAGGPHYDLEPPLREHTKF